MAAKNRKALKMNDDTELEAEKEATLEAAAASVAGDPDAEEKLREIRLAFELLTTTVTLAKATLSESKKEVQKNWSLLKGAVEETISGDANDIARLDAAMHKLHRTELAWQEFQEATDALKERSKDVRADIKAAKASLERAIAASESQQLKLL